MRSTRAAPSSVTTDCLDSAQGGRVGVLVSALLCCTESTELRCGLCLVRSSGKGNRNLNIYTRSIPRTNTEYIRCQMSETHVGAGKGQTHPPYSYSARLHRDSCLCQAAPILLVRAACCVLRTAYLCTSCGCRRDGAAILLVPPKDASLAVSRSDSIRARMHAGRCTVLSTQSSSVLRSPPYDLPTHTSLIPPAPSRSTPPHPFSPTPPTPTPIRRPPAAPTLPSLSTHALHPCPTQPPTHPAASRPKLRLLRRPPRILCDPPPVPSSAVGSLNRHYEYRPPLRRQARRGLR